MPLYRILDEHSSENPILRSPSPLTENQQAPIESPAEEQHPGQVASIVDVPVTPGIHLGEYAPTPFTPLDPARPLKSTGSYFSHNITSLRESMALSPTEAASGARSDHEILRRMSLTGGRPKVETLADIDPREANPSLGLSGGIISATFCIPHSLQHRKGAEWVREFLISGDPSLIGK